MYTTYWWEIIDEDSELCGEQFFTELNTDDVAEHKLLAIRYFPIEALRCLGTVTEVEAEAMGLDTY